MCAFKLVAVTGGRSHRLTRHERRCLRVLLTDCEEFRHGDCAGVDRQAAMIAEGLGRLIEVKSYPADWECYGAAAGPIRNGRMLEGVDLLVAFPGGKGTKSCINIAKVRKITVCEIEGIG